MSECRSCGASIVWAVTDKGRRIPLDPAASPRGNLLLIDGVARVPREEEDVPFLLYVSHFATCPDASKHRKGKP